MKKIFIIIFALSLFIQLSAQTPQELINKVKAKLEKVNDYTAKGKLKTNVVFIKAPIASVKVYYKKPDKMKIVMKMAFHLFQRDRSILILLNFFPGPEIMK
jgi:outer membrane lipoprotein-sorting protein